MMMYNPSYGFFPDVLETIFSIIGISTDVATSLKGCLTCAIDYMDENDTRLIVDPNGHSEGGALEVEIFNAEEFESGGKYHTSVGNRATFGSPLFDPKAENYVVNGDMVPYLNPQNWDMMDSEKVHFFDARDQPFYDRHSFDSDGYQRAFESHSLQFEISHER